MKRITILGGGIGGLTTAIALNKIGIQAMVLEAAPAFHALGAGILLAANAIRAFNWLGIESKIIAKGRLLPSFSILDQKGKTITHADAALIGKKYGLHNFAIHRADLHELLSNELLPGQLQFGKRAIGFTKTATTTVIHFQDGSTHETDYLIAADGIHSAIRTQLLPEATPRYAGYTCWRAVVDAADIQQDNATETWGVAGRMGIVPITDNRIYWFACLNAPPQDAAMRAFQVPDLQRIFKEYHYPVPQMLAQTASSQLIWNDIIDLKPLNRFAYGNILLLGDAGHATTPNMGQGACQAIEDAVVLADEMSKFHDPAAAFLAFEKRRKKRIHFIVNNSWSIGKLAQLENPWLATARNSLFRVLPNSLNERQMKTILTTDF